MRRDAAPSVVGVVPLNRFAAALVAGTVGGDVEEPLNRSAAALVAATVERDEVR